MLTDHWQLQEAKSKFSHLVEKAQNHNPQIVTKHGKEAVVILSIEDYREMQKPEKSLVKFFKESPLAGEDLDIKRDKSLTRDIEL
ncbi:MAG: type II toxin-antitoxin system Phd/YefM family antitoxin [Planctomycetota bacterium]|jgi:prevent-host-death family protein